MTAKTETYHSSQIKARNDQRIEGKPNYVFEKFTTFFLFIILILIGVGSWYPDSSSKAQFLFDSYPFLWYDLLIDISTFCLIGFGFSMSYLYKYGFTSLSMTVLITALSIPLTLYSSEIITYFFVYRGDDNGRISGYQLAEGLFGAIVVLISFGVVHGRLNPSQLACMCLLEIIFWTVNTYINDEIWGLHDTGFTINIHLFATYFALAVAYIIEPAIKDKDKKSIYPSHIFTLIGTMFLWLYWPSFNAYLASNAYYFRDRAIINTLFALCGSTISSFIMSRLLTAKNEDKFDIVHIQQSALSGGVAIGNCVDLYLHPVGAMSIGILSGIISVVGYVFISDKIEKHLKIADTKGIHNVHGMPAILGGFAAVIAFAASEGNNIYADDAFAWDNLYKQSLYTLIAMCTTLLMSLFCGGVTGWIIVMFPFPNYEFKDTDNFNVFFEDLSEDRDPFKDTVRGIYFGGDKPERMLETYDAGDYDWNDGYNRLQEFDGGLGIQVVDSNMPTKSGDANAMDIDVSDWRKCIVEENIMPNIQHVSYANILRDYYFDEDENDYGQEEEEEVLDDDDDDFYPSYCCAKVLKQSFEDKKEEEEYEYYITAKLKSNFTASDFKRKHLNLVIVLDVCGAISSSFKHEIEENKNVNSELAHIVTSMINKQLRVEDRVGIIGVSGKVKILQTLKKCKGIDLDKLRKEITFLRDGMDSSTTSVQAYKAGIELFESANISYDEEYENRIIFITVGLSDTDKQYVAEKYANNENLRIYTTVIGIGIGLTKTVHKRFSFRGSNFVNIENTVELKHYFEEIEKFTYLVTPIFYNINLKLKCSDNCQIDAIYGAQSEKYNKYVIKRGNIMKIHTLFASNESIEIVKSGVLLIKLIAINESKNMNATISVSFENRNEEEFINEKSITFKNDTDTYYDTNSIRKSILLCNYAEILMNWINDNRNSNTKPLYVNNKYKQIFTNFTKYFENEMVKCNDRTLQKELDVLDKLSDFVLL